MATSTRTAVLGLLLTLGVLTGSAASVLAGDFSYVEAKNALFRYERHRAEIFQLTSIGDEERRERLAPIQAKILDLKARLAEGTNPADIEFGLALDAVRSHGRAWLLPILTQGRYTGREAEHHAPLRPLYMPSHRPELETKIFKTGLGYTLLVLLSYDPICRDAYRRFLPRIEDVVRAMEGRIRGPYDYFHPTITPNEMGFDLDAFWNHAHAIGTEVASAYFWDGDAAEVRHVANFLGLVVVAGLVNHIILEDDGTKDELYARTLWRKNGIPWIETDTTHLPNKFDVHHFMSHAWLVYLAMLTKAHYDRGKILSSRDGGSPTRSGLALAFLQSYVAGLGYEVKSMERKGGFREKVAVNRLPRPLRRVAQALGLEEVAGYEACKDLATNRAGAYFGAALYLSGRSVPPSDRSLHEDVVRRWARPGFMRH